MEIKYLPIAEDVKKIINELYESFGEEFSEKQAREITWKVAEDSKKIDENVLFAGATAINDAYMLRNTHPVFNPKTREYIKSLKLRDCKDDKMQDELLEIYESKKNFGIVMEDIDASDIDKRKNFEIVDRVLYEIKDGKYKGVRFSIGKKDGNKSAFLDIANTPFEKLPFGWQESNFAPFEFAYKLVSTYSKLKDDELAAAVHVYWLTSNTWAIDYKDATAVPYCRLDKNEQVKDGDNVVVGKTFKQELKGIKSVNQEICKDICNIARRAVSNKIEAELNAREK